MNTTSAPESYLFITISHEGTGAFSSGVIGFESEEEIDNGRVRVFAPPPTPGGTYGEWKRPSPGAPFEWVPIPIT
jgi:hypothetical protein